MGKTTCRRTRKALGHFNELEPKSFPKSFINVELRTSWFRKHGKGEAMKHKGRPMDKTWKRIPKATWTSLNLEITSPYWMCPRKASYKKKKKWKKQNQKGHQRSWCHLGNNNTQQGRQTQEVSQTKPKPNTCGVEQTI
jgi:hypothetical protein